MDIAEVRSKYPQYGDLPDEDLARGLHQKFYADLPFEDFSKRIGYTPAPSPDEITAASQPYRALRPLRNPEVGPTVAQPASAQAAPSIESVVAEPPQEAVPPPVEAPPSDAELAAAVAPALPAMTRTGQTRVRGMKPEFREADLPPDWKQQANEYEFGDVPVKPAWYDWMKKNKLDERQPPEVVKGFESGFFGGNQKLFGRAAEGAGAIAGHQGIEKWGEEQSAKGKAASDQDRLKPKVGAFSDLMESGFTPRRVFDYLQFSGGSALGSTLPSIAAGAAVGAMTANPFTGILAGAAGPSYIQNFGDVFDNSISDKQISKFVKDGRITKRDVAQVSAVFAVPVAALDLLSLATMLGSGPASFAAKRELNLALKEVQRNWLLTVAKAGLTSGVVEGATEGAQQAISQWAAQWLGQVPDAIKNFYDVIDNMVGGALVGKLTGAGAKAVTTPLTESERRGKLVAEQIDAVTLRPGTVGDLAAAMKHPGTLQEYIAQRDAKAEAAAAAIAAAQPPVAPAPDAAPIAEAQPPAGAPVEAPAAPAGIQADGELGTFTWIDGEVSRGTSEEGGTILRLGDQRIPVTPQDGVWGPAPEGENTPAKPVKVDDASHIRLAEQGVDQNATPDQIKGGSAQLGHMVVQGLPISIENPKGSERRDLNHEPPQWVVPSMPAAYGYVKRTEGADGDQVDVYVGDIPESRQVWVVDQIDPATGNFDEHKILLAMPTAMEAKRTYFGGFSDGSGPQRMGAMTHMGMDQFKDWLKTSNTKKAVAYVKPKEAPNAIRTVPEGKQQAPAVERPATGQGGQAISAEGTAQERPVNEVGPPGAVSQSEVRGEGDGGTTRPASNGGRGNEPVRGEGVPANPVGAILDTINGEIRKGDGIYFEAEGSFAEGMGKQSWFYHIGPAAGVGPFETEKAAKDAYTEAVTRPEAKPTKAALIPTRAPGGGIEYVVQPLREGAAPETKTITEAAPTAEEAAKAKAKAALAALGDILGKNARMNITPEQQKKLMPVLVDLFDAAFTLGHIKFMQATRWVRAQIREALGLDVEQMLSIKDYQGAYISMSSAREGADSVMDVAQVTTLDETKAPPAETIAPKPETIAPAVETTPASGIAVTATTNTKTGEPIWVAKLPAKVSSDEYARTKARAMRWGGYWSRFAKGFIFKSAEMANEFAGAAPTPKQEAPNAKPDNAVGQGEPDGTGPQALEGVPTDEVPAAAVNAPTGAEPVGGGRPDSVGDAGRPGGGVQPVRGMGEKPGTVPPAAGGVRPGQGGTGQPGIRQPGGNEQVAGPGEHRPGEIVPQAGNFVITDELELGKGTPMQKYAGNVAAIKVLKTLERESRDATPEEQRILARYVGWGGLKQAFPAPGAMPAKGWEGRVAEIRGLLTPEEHEAAARSIQDAHFTSKPVVDFMWNVARRLGFNGGKVLEDSMGVGNFFGLMPADLRQGAALTGIELDSITARIAKQLYQKARIIGPIGFEDINLADNTFNLNVGNPPFGKGTPYDKNSKHLNGFTTHNFFFAKAIDKLAPGGLHIQVVSRYLMDAETNPARDYIAHRAELIGAIRLPWTAFYSNAGTEVVTDIIVLQKLREEDWGTAYDSWTKTAMIRDPLGGEDMRINQYYADHMDMIVGTQNRSGEMMFENDITVQPIEGSTLEAQLADVIEEFPEGIYSRGKAEAEVKDQDDAAVASPDAIKHHSVGSYFEDDGKLFVRVMTPDGSLQAQEITAASIWKDVKPGEKNAKGELKKPSLWGDTRVVRVRGMIGIRETERALLQAEKSDAPAAELDMLRSQLNDRYDRYVAEHGYLNEQENELSFRSDPDSPLLLALEFNFDRGVSPARSKTLGVKPRKPTAEKAPIFTSRQVAPYKAPDKAANSVDGLAISIMEKGVVSIEYIASLTGKSKLEVIEDLTKGDKPLAYFDPALQVYETAPMYLSGNVKLKHKQAREAGLMEQADALKAAFPPDAKAGDIVARLGAGWIEPSVYEGFFQHLLGEDAVAKVQFLPATGGWAISSEGGDGVMVNTRWGSPRRSAHDLIARILNNKDMTVRDTDSDGNSVVNKEATQAAQDKADEIRAEFEDWVFKEDARRERLVAFYNENMNTTIGVEWDGDYLTLPGKVPDAVINLRRHQLNAIARWIRTGKILLDHVVGSGKTFTIVAALMEMRRIGLVQKPMIVVPNHLVEQWAISFYQLYPGAKILAMRKADFTKQNRQRMLARVATGDWDAVIFSHSSYGFIDNDKEILVAAIRAQIAEIQQAIDAARATEGKKSRTAAQYQKSKEKMEQRMKALLDKPKDAVLTFQQLGVDQVTVDESQEFKNLFFTTQRRGVGGFGNPNGSKRAFDMFIKAQYLQNTHNGRGVAFATGTPISNSLTELFTLQRYLGLDELKNRGMTSLDAWLANFGVTAVEYESNVTGTKYKRKERLRRITNAPEIMQLYKQFTDSVTQEDVKRNYREDNNGAEFPIPRVKGGKPRTNIVVEASAAQNALSDSLNERAANLPADPRIDNMLAILSDGRKGALDMRLIDPTLPDEPGSKASVAVDNIFRIYTENNHRLGTQLVFLDLSTPSKHGKKDAVRYLKEAREILGDKNAAPFGDLRRQWKELRGRLQEMLDTVDEEEGDQRIVDHLEKFLEQAQDIESAVTAADLNFSVYDDMRTKLIERGVPAGEIAFIHDFNGDTKKQELFDSVNGGSVRILFGSTAKMGAGTNVQRKLVGMHHMDVPWRPSDIEQREGRIIRQGNEFRLADENFEVEILAYATKPSSDVFFWQTQEQKLMGINSLRNFKGEREIDDVSADSMSAAEMKAMASGNPLILEDVQLTEQIRKLEGQRKRHNSTEQDMQSEVLRYQRYIDQLPPIIARQQILSDKIDTYRNDPFEGKRPTADMDGQQMNAEEARAHMRQVKAAADEAAKEANAAARNRQGEIAAASATIKVGSEEFNALEKEHAALEKALAKPKFHVVFDGKEYNGVESANEAVIAKLGDTEAIRVVVDGQDLIRRKDIQAAIDKVVQDWPSIESGRATLGTIGGMPIELEWIQDKHGKGVQITIDGETRFVEHIKGQDAKGLFERKADGQYILSNIERLLRGVHDDLEGNKDALAKATKGIGPLTAELGKPWGKDLELAQKKARVVEVRKLLAGENAPAGAAETDDTKLDTAVRDALTEDELIGMAGVESVEEGIEVAKKNYLEWVRHNKPSDIDEEAHTQYRLIDKAMREGHIGPKYSLGEREYAPGPMPQYLVAFFKEHGIDPGSIEIITTKEREREMRARYGLPNAMSAGPIAIGERDRLYVDDDSDGKPVAIALTAHKYSLGTGERPAANVAAEVRRIASEIAPKANLEMVDRLFGEGPAVVRSGAPSEARIEAAGKYNTGRQLMTVAMNYKDPTKTIRHEAVHALYDMGMFTPAEWTILQRESENRWMKQYGVPDNEEGIAKAFQFYRDGGKFAGPVGRAFDRIRDFLQRLGNALRGLGYQNVDDVFKRIESGEVGQLRVGSMVMNDVASMTLESYAKMPLSYRMAVRDDLNAVLEKFNTAPSTSAAPEKFSLGGDLPDNIAVIQKKTSQDIGPIARFFWNPRNAFAKHPTLAALQQYATDIETQIARTARNLTDEYNGIRGRFKGDKAGWSTLTDALWMGDADGVTFTEQQLREDLGWTDEKTIKAYQDFRTLVTKMGRLVDMHRRSMLPQYRARKAAVLERMRTLTAMDEPAFRSLYGRRTRLRAKLRSGEGDEKALLATLADIEKKMQGIREQTDEYQDLLAEVDRLDGILAETSIRKREGYVPHKFFGTYALYRLVQEPVLDKAGQPTMDEAGKPITETVHQLVAGEHGFYPSQREAIAAAKRASALTPEDAFVVRPVQFKFPNSAATTLTDASYWALMSKASKAMGLSGQDLKDAMEGVARRRFRRRIAGFTQMRTGVEGFSDDMDKVMRAHVGEVTRYVFLDKLKYRAINDMERMGMSPFRSANQQYPTLTRMVEAYLRDINGQKQPGEIAADEALDKILATSWGKPALVGIPAAAAGASLMFGIATNPFVAAAVSSYVGLRLYSSLSKAGEFKSRAITQDLMSDMAHAKLGAIFNMGSAMVNLTQTAINTLPVLGPKYTLMGMIKLEEALRSRIMGKPNEDYRLLERSDTISNDTYTETQLLAVAEHTLARWSLFFFRTTENFNRAVAFLGGYHRAKDRGALPGPAFKQAEAVMGFTQHHYGPPNKAEILRNTFLRVPGQFKNYMMQQVAFTFELGRKGVTGRSIYDEHMQLDRDAILWHLGSLFLVSGTIGLPFVALLNVLIRSIFDYDPLDELKKKALEMQSASKLSAGAWLTMVWGLPAWALGEDVSQRAGMGEQFTPQQLSDLAGPWWGTMDKARQLGELQAGFVDQLANVSPGAGKPLKAIEAMANGMPLWTAATDNKAFFQALADDKINWVSAWKNRTEFDESILSKADVVRMAVGSTPTKVAMARGEVQGIAKDVALDKKVTQLYVNRIISAVRTYGHDEAKLDAALNKIQADMEKANVNVSEKSIKKALADAQTPRLQRAIKGAPNKMRGEASQRATPLMEQGQAQP